MAAAVRAGRSRSRKASTSAIVYLPLLRMRSASNSITGMNEQMAATPVMKPSKPPRNIRPVTPRKAAADM